MRYRSTHSTHWPGTLSTARATLSTRTGLSGPSRASCDLRPIEPVFGQELVQRAADDLGRREVVLGGPDRVAVDDDEIRQAVPNHPLGQRVEHRLCGTLCRLSNPCRHAATPPRGAETTRDCWCPRTTDNLHPSTRSTATTPRRIYRVNHRPRKLVLRVPNVPHHGNLGRCTTLRLLGTPVIGRFESGNRSR